MTLDLMVLKLLSTIYGAMMMGIWSSTLIQILRLDYLFLIGFLFIFYCFILFSNLALLLMRGASYM